MVGNKMIVLVVGLFLLVGVSVLIYTNIISEPQNGTLYSDVYIPETINASNSVDSSNDSVEDASSSSNGDYSGTEDIFTKNVLESYDLDGDGRISRSEWSTWCSYEGYDSMSNADTNGDGYCSKSELNTYSHKYGY